MGFTWFWQWEQYSSVVVFVMGRSMTARQAEGPTNATELPNNYPPPT